MARAKALVQVRPRLAQAVDRPPWSRCPPKLGWPQSTRPDPETPSHPTTRGKRQVEEVGEDEDCDALDALARGPRVAPEQILFEMEAGDFGDLLAELKATHTGLGSLLGGVQSVGDNATMIRGVFEAVDTDRSGLIDKYELQACIEKFNVEADPKVRPKRLGREASCCCLYWGGI